MCLIGPALFLAMFIVPTAIQKAAENPWKIYVVEEDPISTLWQAGSFKYTDSKAISFDLKHVDDNILDVTELYVDSNRTCVLYVGKDFVNQLSQNRANVDLFSKESPPGGVTASIEGQLKTLHQNIFLNQQTTTANGVLASDLLNVNVKVRPTIYNQDSFAEYEAGVSIGLSMLLYLFLLLFGSSVMKGVTEEKTSRIVEVLVSSVKPFQLMLGKIIGIGLTALLQFVLWIVISFVFIQAFQSFYSDELLQSAMEQRAELSQFDQTTDNQIITVDAVEQHEEAAANALLDKFMHFNWVFISVCFFVFFIGGYLLYSSFFAALGAAMDADTDIQQWVFPVTIPLVISLFIALTVNSNPHSDLVFYASLIPFSSPIVMMARLPYLAADGYLDGSEVMQIATAIILLILTFSFTIYIAGRIYRTGILMYGQKVTLKTLYKWVKGN